MEKEPNINSLVYIQIFEFAPGSYLAAARTRILMFGSLAWLVGANGKGNPEIKTAAQLDVARFLLVQEGNSQVHSAHLSCFVVKPSL